MFPSIVGSGHLQCVYITGAFGAADWGTCSLLLLTLNTVEVMDFTA